MVIFVFSLRPLGPLRSRYPESVADHLDTRIEQAYRDQRSRLWGLAYRMTGTPSEADDVLQETFTRAIANPPGDAERELGPWLMRVAVNLAIDRLRKRKLAKYVGPWLPGPVETSTMDPDLDPAERFANLESITAAFLRALELLSPKQRAVLILSQVLEYSGREVAQLLDISEPDARTSLSRARRLLAGAPCQPPSAVLADAHRVALQKFLAALSMGSPEALMALFVPEARGSTDGGGQYRAALKEIVGAEPLTKFWLGLRSKLAANFAVEERELNGLPALVVSITYDTPDPRRAPKLVMQLEVDETDPSRISEIHLVSADAKLRGIGAAHSDTHGK